MTTAANDVTPTEQTVGVNRFRFPDGVEFLGQGPDGNARFTVSIPVDDDGFFGRECPHCKQHFRMSDEDYDGLPDEIELTCVYCGNRDDHNEFMTEQQNTRVMRAASDYANQLVGQMLDQSFGRMARRSRNSVIQVKYRSSPFYPSPLPGVDEERLVRERTCATCRVRYAVFGEHRFCPVCGPLPPLLVAEDALDAETARLDLVGEIGDEALPALREAGVLHRIFVDTIENLVGIVEVLAGHLFRSRVPNAEAILKGRGRVFQRLDDLADLLSEHLGVDARSAVDVDWPSLLKTWADRHVFTHCDGVVDAKYLKAVPASRSRTGQRLQITEHETRVAIANTRALCKALVFDAQE